MLVTEETCLAVVGLSPRRFRELVAAYHVPHLRSGHLTLVRASDLVALVGTPSSALEPDVDAEDKDVDALLAQVGRRRENRPAQP